MNLKKAYYSLRFKQAANFAENYLALNPGKKENSHPFDKVFGCSVKEIQSFLDSFTITASLKPTVYERTMTDSGERLTIVVHPWNKEMHAYMSTQYPDQNWLPTVSLQKFYMDECGNAPTNLLLKAPSGRVFLNYNNIGAIGGNVYQGTHTNLFVGASDIFSASRNTAAFEVQLSESDDWVLSTEVPFFEMATNINGGVEGAHFPLIVDKAHKLKEKIVAAGGIIDNLFVFGGWHNLIYNLNTPQHWTTYADSFLECAPRVIFYGIASPILKYDYATLMKYKDRGMGRWGNLEMTPENYDKLKVKITEYNRWLAAYCADHDNCLMIPTQRIIKYEEKELTSIFSDVNHFYKARNVSELIIKGVNDFLAEEIDFFTPKLSNVSEYIYPTF